MITIISGSRSIRDYWIVQEGMKLVPWDIDTVVSGTLNGADILGEKWARDRQIPVIQCPADWLENRKIADIIRNGRMADMSQALVAFWDGASKGTKNMIDQAIRKGLRVMVIQMDDAMPVVMLDHDPGDKA